MVHRQVGLGRHAERAPRGSNELKGTLLVAHVDIEEFGRDSTDGEVVDPAKSPTLTAHELADVEQPFRRDLDL